MALDCDIAQGGRIGVDAPVTLLRTSSRAAGAPERPTRLTGASRAPYPEPAAHPLRQEALTMMPCPVSARARARWLAAVGLACALGLAVPSASAQPADHPADKPINVGTDFGIAPFVVRTPSGPDGFSIDMVKEVARRIK